MSNLSNIGFGINSRNDLDEIIQKAVALGHITQAVPNEGICVVYTDKSGAELWLKINEDNELTGFNPHFKAQSKLNVCLTAPIYPNPNDPNTLYYHAWANPTEPNKPETGLYPFVFNVADFTPINHQILPQNVQVQLVAFAHNLTYFATEQDFENSQDTDIQLASRLFIPTGLFANNQTPTASPQPLGMILGIIKSFEKRQNNLTQQTFYWLIIDTYGGEIDIVADTNLLPTDPQIGGVVQGQFWLSGQIVGVPKATNN